MEDENVNKYLKNIQKIISSGNPKYMSYISKEYMTYRKVSPMISETIYSMIFKEVNKNKTSPYAIFLDQDGTISLESISDISKISNVSQFIAQVNELSSFNIDFKDLSANDLIIEGSEMAEELVKELNEENLSEKEVSDLSQKADNALQKVGILATIGGTIGTIATGIIAKIKKGIEKLKNKEIKNKLSEQQENNGEKMPEKEKVSGFSFDEICPKVEVNEKAVIENMNIAMIGNKENIKNSTYGDGDPDGDDLNI